MNLDLSPDEQRFQAEVRRFFAEDYPAAILAKMRGGQRLTRDDQVAAQQALQARGWLAATWPAECGGTGWTPVERYLFDAELERAGAPNIIPMALIYIGPIICTFGTPEQKARWLPDILESRAMWAQGYSEPDAGSDLAGLRMSAVRDGDDYVLNGSKIWTSGAHWADWIFCLVRTSRETRRQDGISMICAEMRSPGITVHPIVTIDGGHELNRVDFVDVRVPATNLIGEEGRGWHYANVLLKNERLSYAHIARKRSDLVLLRERAAAMPSDGGGWMSEDPAFRRSLAEVEVEVDALEISVLRALVDGAAPETVAVLKVLCTEMAQRVTALSVALGGRTALAMLDRRAPDWAEAAPFVPPFVPAAVQSYLFERAQTIYGGATEVQKTIATRYL